MMPIQLVAHCTGHETSPFEAQLVAQVIESLSMHMMENARFMAERLHAEFPHEVRMWQQISPAHPHEYCKRRSIS